MGDAGERPDNLTDREREVLGLVRLGLTNEEIAGRLGITLDGAKYHVSEILSKLGVSSREEAALATPAPVAEAFQPRRSRWWTALPLAAKVAAAGTVVAAVAGFGLLAWGALQNGPGTEAGPAPQSAGQRLQTPGPPGWTVDDAKDFKDFSLFWLGENISGMPLTRILHYSYGPPGGDTRYPAENSVRFIYGDCRPRPDQETGCPVPLAVIIDGRCASPIGRPADLDRGQSITILGVPAKVLGASDVVVWTGDAVIEVYSSPPSTITATDAASHLRSVSETGPPPALPSPDSTVCP